LLQFCSSKKFTLFSKGAEEKARQSQLVVFINERKKKCFENSFRSLYSTPNCFSIKQSRNEESWAASKLDFKKCNHFEKKNWTHVEALIYINIF